MPITVKTFATLNEAASALQSDRAARFLAGGTLVMRAINEGDTSFSTVVRSTDRGFTEIRPAGARVTLGAGVTMAQVMANGELVVPASPSRARSAGRRSATWRPSAAICSRPRPTAISPWRCSRSTRRLAMQGGYSGRETPLEEFLANRERNTSLVASVTFNRPNPDAFRFRKVSRVKPKGISVLSIAAHLPMNGGRIAGARVAYGAMAPAPMRAKSVERALEGRALDEAGIAAAVAAAAEGTSPPTDALASAWYRREMVAVHLKRLLSGTA